MKIILVTEFFPDEKNPVMLGGVQARTFYVAQHLRKKHDVKIISLDQGSIEATTSSLLRRLIFITRTSFAVLPEKPDLIEASNVVTYLPSFILASRLKVAKVGWIPDVLGQSWWENFSFPVALAGSVIEQVSLKLNWDYLIAMSKTTKEKLVKAGIDQNKITVVYGGVDYSMLSKLKVKKFTKPTICSIARLLSYKRLGDLVEAVNILRSKIPNIQCYVIGEGPEEKKIRLQIANYQLQNHFKLVGNMPHADAMKILKRSHIFCLPSVVEGFGIVTIEAMAAGVPFVNARITPTMEITQNGQGGLFFEPKNHRDLAEKINTLMNDNFLYKKKVSQGKKLAKNFDWSIIAKQTEKVYKDITLKKSIKGVIP